MLGVARVLSMKMVLLLVCFAAHALAEAPKSAGEKAELMFLLPGEFPFSFETLYGSPAALAAIKAPEKIEVYRIDPSDIIALDLPPATKTILGHPLLSEPVVPTRDAWAELVSLLTTKDAFREQSACAPSFGVLARVSAGRVTVDLLFCFQCCDLDIIRNDDRQTKGNPSLESIRIGITKPSAKRFLLLFQTLFPDDRELKDVKLK
jgi:hypothetical protein